MPYFGDAADWDSDFNNQFSEDEDEDDDDVGDGNDDDDEDETPCLAHTDTTVEIETSPAAKDAVRDEENFDSSLTDRQAFTIEPDFHEDSEPTVPFHPQSPLRHEQQSLPQDEQQSTLEDE